MKTDLQQILLTIAITFIIFVLLLFFGCLLEDDLPPDPSPPTPVVSLGRDGLDFHNRKFTVVNVVDGDTVDIALSLVDPNTTRIRLLGVDTPETKHPRMSVQYFGPEATLFVIKRTLHRTVTVHLDPASDIRGSYGRLLAYIELSDGTDLGEQLLTNGLGYAYTQYPCSRRNHYIELERTARAAKIGLWKNVTFDQLPPWIKSTNPDILNQEL